ncbi:hypothetical protein [Enterobacter hormaechei]|uniref:hypothetical protein n=1 Tax=Enterobacter hormaechei TaxID=158836 RepID=UPI0024124E19|nr:hypothetical protein [Enterobacter hormaechei]
MKLKEYLETLLNINSNQIKYNGMEDTHVAYDWNTSYKDHLVQTGLIFEVKDGVLEITA